MVTKQALPVMGGMASQNILNVADSVMVGRLGTACVAAVGIASTLNFQCQAALQGISSGVQAMSSRRIGENRPEVAAVPLNAALAGLSAQTQLRLPFFFFFSQHIASGRWSASDQPEHGYFHFVTDILSTV